MNFIQSFWTCGRSMLEESFGWLTPQHHLISWALSSLLLREHYENLHLYADRNAHDILVNKLRLPFTKVVVAHDDIDLKHSNHFAISKLRTYEAQQEPFIHVDGDVFIFNPFDSKFEDADLVAQNLEHGTEHYKLMIEKLRNELVFIPDHLKIQLDKPSIPAYNAGVIGGRNISFLNRYAKAALELIRKNCDDTGKYNFTGNFNILFEQMLFYSLVEIEKKEITNVIKESIPDFGYSKSLFADFSRSSTSLNYLHIIGGKKKDEEICNLMSRTLFQRYPEYFERIAELFNRQHRPNVIDSHNKRRTMMEERLVELEKAFLECSNNKADQDIFRNKSSSQISEFQKQLKLALEKWRIISDIKLREIDSLPFNGIISDNENFYDTSFFKTHEGLIIIEQSFEWTPLVKQLIKPLCNWNVIGSQSGIVIIPDFSISATNEVPIDELEYNIVVLLQNPLSFDSLTSMFAELFVVSELNELSSLKKLLQLKIKRLFLNKCILIYAGRD